LTSSTSLTETAHERNPLLFCLNQRGLDLANGAPIHRYTRSLAQIGISARNCVAISSPNNPRGVLPRAICTVKLHIRDNSENRLHGAAPPAGADTWTPRAGPCSCSSPHLLQRIPSPLHSRRATLPPGKHEDVGIRGENVTKMFAKGGLAGCTSVALLAHREDGACRSGRSGRSRLPYCSGTAQPRDRRIPLCIDDPYLKLRNVRAKRWC